MLATRNSRRMGVGTDIEDTVAIGINTARIPRGAAAGPAGRGLQSARTEVRGSSRAMVSRGSAETHRAREGETRLCLLGPDGAFFETDYNVHDADARLFTVLWFNADATGFMDEANGDRILSVRF